MHWDNLWPDIPPRAKLMMHRLVMSEAREKEQREEVRRLELERCTFKEKILRLEAKIASIEEITNTEGYWERQWRSEAKAREWAEAKLYERKLAPQSAGQRT